ncbi:MAG: DUF6443 domain-containing protein [Agriterribacter sp.]
MRKLSTLSAGLSFLMLLALSLPAKLLAQYPAALPDPFPSGTKVNYIRTWDAKAPEDNAATLKTRALQDVQQTTQYFDGLGRPLQTVVKQGSLITDANNPTSGTNATDLVTHTVYDEFGREHLKYLPFVTTATDATKNDGSFKLNPLQQQVAFYNAFLTHIPQERNIGPDLLNWAYSKTNFEPSPLNRVDNTYAPGNYLLGTESLQSESSKRNVRIKYYTNTTTDEVKMWTVNSSSTPGEWGTFSNPTNYAAGTLYKTITIDENDKQVIAFKDKEGKVVLKKVQLTASDDAGTGRNHSGWLCTYYLYDDLGNLRCVIQPRGVELISQSPYNWQLTDAVILNEQCFRYEYDQRRRMIRKKVPGAGAVSMVYDSRDRLVLTQDANQAAATTPQWLYTQYDALNRPVATGIWTTATSFSAHVSAAAAIPSSTVSTYPNTGTAGLDELTRVFYDDYTWRASYSNPLADTYNNSYDTYFQTVTSSWPYATANTKSEQTLGLVTGTRTKILGTSTYLYTVNIYDAKARVIQVYSQNSTDPSAVDILTTQYSWAGQPLVTVQKQENKTSGSTAQTTVIVNNMTYDALGRLVKTEKKLGNTLVNSGTMSAYAIVSTMEYDAMGRLKKKLIGNKKDPATGLYYTTRKPLQTLTYEYNLTGALLNMNRSYLGSTGQAPSSDDRVFAFELGYENPFSSIGRNYKYKQYNGNISGFIWKSDGDDIRRKYDFEYDAAGRLLKADFDQQNLDASWNANLQNFAVKMGDGTSPASAYDANGNIKRMQQWGINISGVTQTDDLTYNYAEDGKSNRLLNISDAFNDAQTRLGDFRVSVLNPVQTKTTTTADYSYDANGNMVKDLNKDIVSYSGDNGIVYNHLNLPQQVTIKKSISVNKGAITYTYDAAGNKLKKTVVETGATVRYNGTDYTSDITTTVLYLGGMLYESKDYQHAALSSLDYTNVLQSIAHEEGRIRFKPENNTFEYDYFLKDHLGNVRAVLTEEIRQDVYPIASMETATAALENTYYSNIDNSRYARAGISGYPTTDNTTTPNDYVARTNGSDNKIGPCILLKVMSGDKFNISVKSWYKKNGATPGTPVDPLLSLIAALSSGVSGTSSLHGTAGQIESSGVLDPAVNGFLPTRESPGTDKPKAYLNYILLNEQLKFVSDEGSGSSIVGNDEEYKTHTITEKLVTKNGYLYIYVSNETPNIDVFFDNLQVNLKRGALLEETHYYPFGLTMAGISSKALNGVAENKRKYNGIEFNEDLDLDIYDAYYRNLDPQTGRWWQIDPEIENMEAWSPYVSNFDNPIFNSDPLGDEPDGCCSVLDELLDIGEKTVLSLSGVVNGVLNTVSGGLISTDPFSMRDNLDPEEQRLYDNSVQVGQIGGLFSASSRSPKLTPALQPVGGPAMPLPAATVKPVIAVPPVLNTSGESKNTNTSNSQTSKSQGQNSTASNSSQSKQSKVQKSTKTEEVGGGKFRKTTETKPGKGPGQSRAEYVRIKNKNGKVIRTYKDSYDRANKFQSRKPLRGGPEGRPQNE